MSFDLNPKRRCKCVEHTGAEPWHGTPAGYTNHGCRCDRCREGKSEQRRAYYEANREKIAEQDRAYQEANREQIAKRRRRYYEENREQILEKRRVYREAWRDVA